MNKQANVGLEKTRTAQPTELSAPRMSGRRDRSWCDHTAHGQVKRLYLVQQTVRASFVVILESLGLIGACGAAMSVSRSCRMHNVAAGAQVRRQDSCRADHKIGRGRVHWVSLNQRISPPPSLPSGQ